MKIWFVALCAIVVLGFLMSPDARAQSSPVSPPAKAETVRQAPEANRSYQTGPARKGILLLFPYQPDLPVTMLAERTIREEFAKVSDFACEMYYEYMDLSRFAENGYQQKLLDLYAVKYRSKKIDLVLVPSERMLNIWLEQRKNIAPDAPVVFFDILTTRLAGRQLPENVTGVSATVEHAKSVEWILHTRPSVKEIVIVHGVGKADQEYLQSIDAVKKEMGGQVRFTDLSDLPLPEIKKRVATLPKSSVVLYHLMFEDAAGDRYRPIDVLRQLASVSPVPIISGYDQYIGSGTIGGYMYSIEEQARETVRMGSRILRGEPVSSIPIASNRSNRFIFDHIVLQRFNIPLSDLPPGSIIKNRQYSVWERYGTHIIATIAVFAVLVIVVVLLSGITRRLNKTRLALSGANVELKERTAAVEETNRRLEKEIGERKEAENRVRALLAEKEILLREVHHRIKNNMNVIMSLLSLQATTLQDLPAAAALRDSRSRVQSMMILYDKLYRSTDFRAVSAKEYLGALIGEIMANFHNRERVAVDTRIDDATLDAKTLSPVGMILNELLTNAMKHAFAGKSDGAIGISFSIKGNHAVLTFEDNGVGIPESVDIADSTGFGLQVVDMLTEQLEGTIRLERVNGSRFTLEFDVR